MYILLHPHSPLTLTLSLAKVSSEAPFNIIFPTIFAVIAYFLIGYDYKADKFFIFLVALIALTNTMAAFGP